MSSSGIGSPWSVRHEAPTSDAETKFADRAQSSRSQRANTVLSSDSESTQILRYAAYLMDFRTFECRLNTKCAAA